MEDFVIHKTKSSLMKKILKKILTSLIPFPLIEQYLLWKFGYTLLSYSLNGEDIIVWNLTRSLRIQNGFFVDVGAHHPTIFSNTYRLYREGWRGINIDAAPGKIDLFRTMRAHDINVEAAIADVPTEIQFHLFEKSALNTGSAAVAKEQQAQGHKVKEVLSMHTQTLAEVLRAHLPSGQKIDFLTIDIEGFDLMALRSNDWSLYIPTIIAIEDRSFDPQQPTISDTYTFLREHHYSLVAYTGTTLVFQHKNS